MSDEPLPLEGGCLCGQVRIRVSAPPLLSMACHCTGCQRMTASAFSLGVAIPSQGFEVIRGEPAIGALHGPTRHHFCPHCMSWVFTRPQGTDALVTVRATMLDDTRWAAPFVETYTCEKLPWVTTPAAHSYERFPPFEDFDRLIAGYAVHRAAGGPGRAADAPPDSV
jgi:hypothetical protein